MSESQPESGPAALVAALNVPTHAKRGFFLAAILTVAVFGFFVAVPGAERPLALYVGLAFVLFVSLGALVTAIFVAGSLISQVRDL